MISPLMYLGFPDALCMNFFSFFHVDRCQLRLKRGKILAKEKKRFLDPHIGQLCDSSAFTNEFLK